MNENLKWSAAAAIVVCGTVGAFLYFGERKRPAPPPPVESVIPEPTAVPPPDDSAPRNPLPQAQTQQPLPSLDESDAPVGAAVTEFIGKGPFEQFLVPKDLVRHIVVSIDNLPEAKVAEKIRFVKPVGGTFAVSGTDEAPVLDPSNYSRYEPLVKMVRSMDTQRLLALYGRYYPLFQDSYENLGHPPKYFNDRLVEVIDHLLATPEVHDPIELARPNVMYTFADPNLESLSAGQKALIRMGSENAAAVKAKLRELRAALLALPRR